jgi:hypothetical protein
MSVPLFPMGRHPSKMGGGKLTPSNPLETTMSDYSALELTVFLHVRIHRMVQPLVSRRSQWRDQGG